MPLKRLKIVVKKSTCIKIDIRDIFLNNKAMLYFKLAVFQDQKTQ